MNLTVTDLDGTLVRCNTLHVYIRCGVRQMYACKKYLSLVKALTLMALRRLKIISHARMKFGVCRLIDYRDIELRHMFENEIKPNVNTALVDVLQKNGEHVLLATAAPDVYVPWIWKGDYVATRMDDNYSRLECRGEEKLRRVEEFATAAGLSLCTFYTDHIDDLPLILRSDDPVLVNPDKSTEEYLRRNSIRFRYFDA